jgi:MFS family permease
VIGPLLAGVLIDTWGWRTIFIPALAAALLAAFVVRRCIPDAVENVPSRPDFLNSFDWAGVVLLSAAATSILLYVSSRLVTGVPALRDWRLLALACLSATSFVFWEKRQANPFIALGILRLGSLARASLCASVRMVGMSSMSFLLPLYLADIQNLSASWIGPIFLLHSGSLLVTMRLGGQLADRWGSRRPVALGMSMQVAGMVYFAFLPSTAVLPMVVLGLVTHSLGAGLAQAALHRAAMGGVPQAQTGMAAGVYSMLRFSGTVLGPAVEGVLLQAGLDRGLPTITAYQHVYSFVAGVGLLGVLVALTLREQPEPAIAS